MSTRRYTTGDKSGSVAVVARFDPKRKTVEIRALRHDDRERARISSARPGKSRGTRFPTVGRASSALRAWLKTHPGWTGAVFATGDLEVDKVSR